MPWKNKNPDINSENIFDEFIQPEEIKTEIEKNDLDTQKDIYYYLKKISTVVLFCNVFLFLWFIVSLGYIYIQNNSERTEYSFLTPVCNLILWSKEITPGTCFGISPILNEYSSKLQELQLQQSSDILPLLGEKYWLENFNLSRKIAFILEKWENRLMPLDILSDFDEMKDTFSATDKSEISCYNMSIVDDMLSMTCDSFSSDWNTDILWVDDTVLKTRDWWGTSISKASSFINFLENYSETPFIIVDKPEFYNSETTTGPYTRKTTFNFTLLHVMQDNFDIN